MNTADGQSWHALTVPTRLVARLWQTEVDSELLALLAQPALRDEWIACGGFVPAAIKSSVVDDLAAEYCRLFLGPRDHLPPYQSVWTQQRFHGDATVSTAQFRELLSDHAPSLPAGTPPDHLGYQLELWSPGPIPKPQWASRLRMNPVGTKWLQNSCDVTCSGPSRSSRPSNGRQLANSIADSPG